MHPSFAHFGNLALIEKMYKDYQKDPEALDPTWRAFFEGVAFGAPYNATGGAPNASEKIIDALRTWGHLEAQVNPLSSTAKMQAKVPELAFSASDLAAYSQEIAQYRSIYCERIGFEFMDRGSQAMREWIISKIEPSLQLPFTQADHEEMLQFLSKAELFEAFLHTKYVGQKRFSLEGAETLIPMLGCLLERGDGLGLHEVVIGMAHRGRLNVLCNILGKSYAQIFHEFEDHLVPDGSEGTGDVKYHKGFQGELALKNGKKIAISLAANPSHLEAVDPVVEGQARARQEKSQKIAEVLPILIHGDAALAGQGVVYETLQLGGLEGYRTGGTVHIIINNQIGFTTLPKDGRSTSYATDIAKSFGAPVFHVNAEDPEAAVFVAMLAIEIRQKFAVDVFIDLIGYRKYGHNEGDEPAFTQPVQQQEIKQKETIRTLFKNRLIVAGKIQVEEAEKEEKEFQAVLEKHLATVKSYEPSEAPSLASEHKISGEVDTKLSLHVLKNLAEKFCRVPEDFAIHPKVQKLLQERLASLDKKIDWAMAEHLAFASLVAHDKIGVRLSGQDVRRGTFSQRHAVLVDQKTSTNYTPLAQIAADQAPFEVYNSPLSEYAVLGFEFGYSLEMLETLTLWEAQFGDFFNGAQIIIDQFLAASEQKWGQTSTLTLLLPHGYEGQGPEHSSARIERFLQLAGHDNLRIVNCSTPAQYFHVLRRQGLQKERKPLIIFTPKALLRHPDCVSSITDFTEKTFQPHILTGNPDPEVLIVCSGKVYYDIAPKMPPHYAILRIEQLYPLDLSIVSTFTKLKEIRFIQEEPENMGAWQYIQSELNTEIPVHYIGREKSASTAAGSFKRHKQELEKIIQNGTA